LERLNDQELAHATEVYSSLVRTPFRDLIATKDELWEFWLDKNKDRRVGELLEESNTDDDVPKTDKPRLHQFRRNGLSRSFFASAVSRRVRDGSRIVVRELQICGVRRGHSAATRERAIITWLV
jgi:hypothetical protein